LVIYFKRTEEVHELKQDWWWEEEEEEVEEDVEGVEHVL